MLNNKIKFYRIRGWTEMGRKEQLKKRQEGHAVEEHKEKTSGHFLSRLMKSSARCYGDAAMLHIIPLYPQQNDESLFFNC